MARKQQFYETALTESVIGFAALVLFLCFFMQGIPHYSQILLAILVIVLLIWLAYRATKPPSASSTFSMFAFDRYQTEKPVRKKAPAVFGEDIKNARQVPEPIISEKLRKVDWFQFEKLIELIYRHHGFSVKRFGGAKADGSVELIVESPTEEFVVQCNPCRKSKVGVRNIRELAGTLTDNKIPKGILITMADYSGDARLLASQHDIQILNELNLIETLEQSGLIFSDQLSSLFSDKRIFCPQCENEMVLRMAHLKGNQFWECSNFPRCKYTIIRES